MQYGSLVNHDYSITNVMIHLTYIKYVTIHTSSLIMGKLSWWLRQVNLLIKRECTIVLDGWPKSMNQLWSAHSLARKVWLGSCVQVLMHLSNLQYKW